MWRLWMWYDPKRLFVLLYLFLAVLAFTIHFILLSTERYNWLEAPRSAVKKAAVQIELVKPS
jgi:light-harvesting complex 1 alpha chain